MVYKSEILRAVDELDESCSATDVASLLGLDLAEAALGLLRCYRAGLLDRWKAPASRSEKDVYHYDLTPSGADRLLWLEQEGGANDSR